MPRPPSPRRTLYARVGKRTFDVLVVSIVLVMIAPVLALVSVAVLVSIGRPILHTEPRAGRGGAPFLLRKFRTMTLERDAAGELLPDARRLTRVGRWLRSTSLDELPQLLQVVQGHMSLVGPRPLPTKYVSRYTREQGRRLEVLPGITGLAQIRGRNTITWDERFALDVCYVDRHSAWLDLKILCLTALVVLRREGVNHPSHATMHEFLGQSQ